MTVFPLADGVLLVLLAVGCTSPQQSLLRVGLVVMLLLLTHLFRALLNRLSLPFDTATAVILSLGAGTALCLLLRVAFPTLPPLEPPTDPIVAMLLVVCGICAAQKHTTDWRLLPSMVLIGAIRELLSEGTLWGITLLPLGVSPTLGNGAGGLLIAALVLWCFRLHPPLLTAAMPNSALLSIGGLAAVASVAGILTASLPLSYSLWGITVVGSLIAALLPKQYAPDGWLFVIPAAVLLTRNAALWWPPVIAGGCVLVGIVLLNSLHRRLHLTPPASRFQCAPAALAIASMLSCISAALPIQM